MASKRGDPAIRAEQERLRAAGYYTGEIDGVEGNDTRAARAAADQAANAQRAKAESDKAAADIANANARAAEAVAKAKVAEADQAKIKADKDTANRSPTERAIQVGMNVGFPVAGIAAGHYIAKGIQAEHLAAARANNKEVAALGKQAAAIVGKLPDGNSKAKIAAGLTKKAAGIAETAKGLSLTRMAGPLGLGIAASLVAEAALARFVIAPSIENESAREVINAVSSGSIFAATNIVGTRAVQNATLKVIPDAGHVAAINTVKAVAGVVPDAAGAASVAAKAAGGAGVKSGLKAAAKLAGRAALPLAVAMSAFDAYKGYQKDGLAGAVKNVLTLGMYADSASAAEALPSRTNSGGTDRAVNGAIGVGGLAIGAMMIAESRARGVGLVGRVLLKAGGGLSIVTGGVAIMSSLSGSAKADPAPAQPDPGSTAAARVSKSRLMLERVDALRTTSAMRRTDTPIAPQGRQQPAVAPGRSGAGRKAAAKPPASDGFAEGYTRVRNGKTEQVQGYHIQPRRS